MDIERGNLKILFIEIPPSRIGLNVRLERDSHTYDNVNKKLYLEYARRIFLHYSEDEILNNYFLLDKEMKDISQKSKSVFCMISKIASRMLTLHSSEIQCKLGEMLRWRDISFHLGQEIFTCAFLAEEDNQRGTETKFFAWEPIIGSDDMRLDSILKRGIAENHFHLNGSTKIFELNWICLMNHIENRGKEFQKFEKILQHEYVNESEKKDFYVKCQEASLYRLYLFTVMHGEVVMAEELRKNIIDIENGRVLLWERLSDLQEKISLIGALYGATNDQGVILDYALEKDTYDYNNNCCRLLSGERRFLYCCYRQSLRTGEKAFSEFDKNVFYRYLVIRTYFRSELVQVNQMVGYSNFEQYQLRKEHFIDGKKEYEYELIRLAVNASFQKQNIISLEARICPEFRSAELNKKLNRKFQYIDDNEIKEKTYFVLHFPKQKDERNTIVAPRNLAVRRQTEKYTKAIVALLEKEGEACKYIRGIDACAGEIGCRPEVFGQYYRYLLDYSIPVRKRKSNCLRATYHAGEDFLDIIDGLRAIDEAILFCGMSRGSRLGHALALGISAAEYYRFKGNMLVIPKQDLLDNLAWVLVKKEQYGCLVDEKLKTLLEQKFYELFYEIYSEECLQYRNVTYLDYYNSWMLRGDNPENYLLTPEEFERRLASVPLLKLYRYDFNNAVSDTVRRNEKYRRLFMLYHFDDRVRRKGEGEEVFKIPCGYASLVKKIQDKMIQELVYKGIGIETNPSSNYLIGPIQKYEEHPIIRFNGRKLKETETNMSLQVSINTDDQGVFDTSLENEYALMTIALKKAKTEDEHYKYDIEDIYAWVDYVRQMGITQAFTNCFD